VRLAMEVFTRLIDSSPGLLMCFALIWLGWNIHKVYLKIEEMRKGIRDLQSKQ
jgi:hypothetical protein